MLVDALQGVVGAIQITLVKETERLDVRLRRLFYPTRPRISPKSPSCLLQTLLRLSTG